MYNVLECILHSLLTIVDGTEAELLRLVAEEVGISTSGPISLSSPTAALKALKSPPRDPIGLVSLESATSRPIGAGYAAGYNIFIGIVDWVNRQCSALIASGQMKTVRLWARFIHCIYIYIIMIHLVCSVQVVNLTTDFQNGLVLLALFSFLKPTSVSREEWTQISVKSAADPDDKYSACYENL